MKRRFYILALALLLIFGSPGIASANCTNPASVEGKSIYNTTYHVPQFCDGTNWIAYGAISPSGGGSCSHPAGPEGDVIYNNVFHLLQYCNGTSWQAVGGGCHFAPPPGSGYFVLTQTTYNGNRGSLAAADAQCLTELGTTHTGWKGYTTANANGQIVSSKVHAFLCDTGTCNNLMPQTTYYFANAGNSAAGGASFTTDAAGFGPYDGTSWAGATYFSGTYNYWSNRTNSSCWDSSAFGGGPGQSTNAACGTWNSASSGSTGVSGNSAQTDWKRWGSGWCMSATTSTCDSSLNLICLVNP